MVDHTEVCGAVRELGQTSLYHLSKSTQYIDVSGSISHCHAALCTVSVWPAVQQRIQYKIAGHHAQGSADFRSAVHHISLCRGHALRQPSGGSERLELTTEGCSWGYRSGSPTTVQAWQPCPLWEPSPSHPILV